MSQSDAFADALRQILGRECRPDDVRAIEAGGSHANLWKTLDDAGFADALTFCGDDAVSLADVYPMVEACGAHALPVPLAQSMFARGLLVQAGIDPPPGASIALASGASGASGIVCHDAGYGQVADWALVCDGAVARLLPCAAAQLTPRGNEGAADLSWNGQAVAKAAAFPAPATGWREIEAAIYAAQLAGAMSTVLAATIQYANDRVQFGKPIGKFQAIQHQIGVMAEQTWAARMAAMLAFSSRTHTPVPQLAAAAKARTSEAAAVVAALAHAVHGAIGFTQEFDLQLHTRRLYAWRLATGSEGYWNAVVGRALIGAGQSTALEFMEAAFAQGGLVEPSDSED